MRTAGKMKAAVFRGAGQVEVVDVPMPDVGAGEVLVRVHYCGICGSDLEAYRTGMYEPGMVIGHEFAGEIEQVGEKVEIWAKGDSVAVNDAIPCGRCGPCRQSRPTLCDDLVMPGITLNGGMAEYAVIPAQALHKLPEGVSMRQGALAEPLAVALHGVRRSALQPGDDVLVMGAGTIGLLTAKCALLAGAREVCVSEVDPARASLAAQFAASAVLDPGQHNLAVEMAFRCGDGGPAVVYVCTGARSALEDAMTLAAKGGQIMLLGLVVEPTAGDFFTLVLHELNIHGSYLGYEEFPEALELLAQGKVGAESLITHEIGLDEVVSGGFQVLDRPNTGAVKVMVKMIQ
jgi:(R,R)-butanediol dehydrogenase/meso-butanediol dehydrogenase/diacetyl reductase